LKAQVQGRTLKNGGEGAIRENAKVLASAIQVVLINARFHALGGADAHASHAVAKVESAIWDQIENQQK
jgi:hypothetical protein